MPSSRAAQACGVCVEVTAAPRRVPCRVAPLSGLRSRVYASREVAQSASRRDATLQIDDRDRIDVMVTYFCYSRRNSSYSSQI